MEITRVGGVSGTANATDLSLSWSTAGGGADPQANDFALLIWNGQSGLTWNGESVGFALLDAVVADSGTHEGRVYYRVCDGINETGTLDLTHSAINKQTALLEIYRGVSTTVPISDHATRDETTAGTTHANPQVTTGTANEGIVTAIQERVTDSSTSFTAPSPGYTKRLQPTPIGGGGSTSAAVADDGLAVSRAALTNVTPPDWTNGVSTANVITWTIALRPDAEAHSGSATITGTLAMAATGAPDFDGSATVTGALAVAATGTPDIGGGTATIGGTLTMTARGTADTGIGTPPRPRTRWQLVLGAATGGHELALTVATGRRYTARLTDNSDLAFSIDGRHAQAAEIGELTTDVHLLFSDADGTTILDRCRVGATGDDIDENQHRTEVTCLDYRAVLARRRLYTGDTLTYSATDQAEIAWGLISSTQAQESGALGIAKGWTGTTPTGVNRDRTYEAGDSVGERIQELSELIGGFDWDITPTSASALRLDVWHPRRGTDRGVVLVLGGLAAAVRREVNPADYANAIRYTGAETTAAVEREAALLSDTSLWPQGRWDAVYGDDGLTTQAALDARAEWQLAEAQVVTPVYTVRLARGAWDGPDHVWLGDTVRLIIPSGRLDVDTTARVHEVEIDMDGDGGETVTLTLGGPRPDFRRWPSEVDKRLRNLERR